MNIEYSTLVLYLSVYTRVCVGGSGPAKSVYFAFL